jgi:hypothetical protein
MLQYRNPAPLRLGVAAGYALAILCLAYAVVLGIGLYTLPSPDRPIQRPWLTGMEVLILAIVPVMVAFMVALHAWAPDECKPIALLGIAFMSMCAVVTCSVHFAILTLSRQPSVASAAWAIPVFSFKWPSVAYALDILAWDVFFPLAALCAASAVPGPGLATAARVLLWASAALAFAGLAGVPLADMKIRDIGIVGYVVLFPMAAVLMAILFGRPQAGDLRLQL